MAGTGRDDMDRGALEEMGRSMGGLAGRAADAAARIGGSMISGAAEVLGGWWAESAGEASRSWSDAQDRRSRQHFESSMDASTGSGSVSAEAEGDLQTANDSDTTSSYERARPYYQLGHTARQNPEYESRNFEDVEPDLRRVAESGASGSGAGGEAPEGGDEWPEVRGYVEFGYEQGEGERG